MSLIRNTIKVAIKDIIVRSTNDSIKDCYKLMRVDLFIKCLEPNVIKRFTIIDADTQKTIFERTRSDYKFRSVLDSNCIYCPDELLFDEYKGNSKNIYVEVEFEFEYNNVGDTIIKTKTYNIEGK